MPSTQFEKAFKMNLASDDITRLKFEKLVASIRSGIPVQFIANDKNYCFIALEALSKSEFDKFTSNTNSYLVINNIRAHFIHHDYNDTVLINIKDLSYEQLFDIAGVSGADIKLSDYNSEISNIQVYQDITKVLIFAEMLPSFIMIEMSQSYTLFEVFAASVSEQDRLMQDQFNCISRTFLDIKSTNKPVEIVAFRSDFSLKEHYAIIIGNALKDNDPIVRLHSSCYPGDLLGSLACDCQDQFESSIAIMDQMGGGIITYLIQEGRGIGLVNNLRAYNLQAQELDTVDANLALGFPSDARILWPSAQILKLLGISSIKLLTNNQYKANELSKFGINVVRTIPHIVNLSIKSQDYMQTKVNKMGHKNYNLQSLLKVD